MNAHLRKLAAAVALAALAMTGAACGESAKKADVTSAATSAEPVANEQSAGLKKAIKDDYGTTSWGMTITDVKIDGGNATIRAQIASGDKESGKKIERGVVNLIKTSDEFKEVKWVIVEDGTGTVVTQQQL